MSLTPKMERFCQCIVSGMSGKDSYYEAYNTTCKENTAYREAMVLLKREDVQERIKELRKPIENHIAETSINERQKHIDFIKERIQICIENNDENSILRYTDQLAKIGGYYKETEKEEKTENVINKLDTTTLLRLVE